MIPAPTRSSDYPDRALDCELAIEPFFNEVMSFVDLTGKDSRIVAITMVRHCGVGHLPPVSELEDSVHEAFSTLMLVATTSGWSHAELIASLAGLSRRHLRKKTQTTVERETGNETNQPAI